VQSFLFSSFLLFSNCIYWFCFFSFFSFSLSLFGQPEAQAICWYLSATRLDCVCTVLLRSRACSSVPLTSIKYTPACSRGLTWQHLGYMEILKQSLTWQHQGCMGNTHADLHMTASEGVKHPGNTNLDANVITGQLHCWASVWI